jgi:glucose-1-phosphate thymidylyltransferase
MAGKGTRLRPQTLTLPKPLYPIGDKSIVEHLITLVKKTIPQIDEVHFVIHPTFGPEVEKQLTHLGERYQMQTYLHYQEEQLGTAHAIYQAKDALSGPILIIFADTLFISEMQIDPNLDGIIWCKEVEDPRQFGVVFLNTDGHIIHLVEKPEHPESNLAITGIYYLKNGELLKSKIEQLLRQNIKSKGEYQLTDALQFMIQEGARMGVATIQEWLDCGSRDALLATQSVWFRYFPPPEPPKKEGVTIIPPVFLHHSATLSECTIGPYVTVGPNARITRSIIQHSIIREGAVIENALFHHSLIGAHAEIKGKERVFDLSDYSRFYEVE